MERQDDSHFYTVTTNIATDLVQSIIIQNIYVEGYGLQVLFYQLLIASVIV